MSMMLDAERLSRLISNIYDAALDPGQWSAFMANARQLIGVEHSVFMLIDQRNPQNSIINYEGFDPHFTDEILERRETEDYYYLALKQSPKHRVALGTDLIPLDDMRRRPFYHEIARKVNCEWLVGAVTENSPGYHGCFTFLRDKDSGSFSEQHKTFVALLLPHIQKSLWLQRQLAQRDSFIHALDASPYGVIVLDASKAVLFYNSTAERYFREQDGLSLRQSKVKLIRHSDQVVLDQAIDCALSPLDSWKTNNRTFLSAGRKSGNLDYHIEVLSLNRHSEARTLMDNAACLLFIHDPVAPVRLSLAGIRAAYGLTQAEARTCRLLFEGCTLQETADTLKISRNTAKSHLKHIFEKCQVSSQAQLIRLLALGLK